MNAVSGAARFSHRFEGLRERLPGARLPWLTALRDGAAATFATLGFPTRRAEAWKYTDLAPIGDAGFDEPLTLLEGSVALPPAGAARAVFVDGRFRADLATLDGLAFSARSLAGALDEVEGPLGALAQPARDAMAALNTMLFEDGLLIDVQDGVDGGVLELLSVATASERPQAFHPRHLIRLGRGASLTIIETAMGTAGAAYLHNPVFEIGLEEDARLTHGRLQQESRAGFHLSTIYARVAGGAVYDNFTLNAGARLVRNEIHVALTGPKGACHMNGAQLIGDGQHADTATVLDHAAPDCASRQTYKTVLAGRARGVFQGRIHVHQAAQRTDGYQMNQALLLSEDAEMDSKPQLEIYADDVKCSHGATVGALDADQMFYLRARGIPEPAAKAMLVEAFLIEAVEQLPEGLLRERLTDAIAGWWQGQEAAA
ncbi:Fe-S cluster assembly protein SufD [Plastoroseomonas arctica]|uniref:Fe-S cluster assembly protein SufD n=1 Tax=Plastoroseomonas arctica TaxID=1509237 RepID=A0AAF1JZ52_9PROT|nr:Fe-S cluster assembly protein SufD [Plastoroseomonas arctica]MBR0656425.1 Fe-S cluster assembly protein SufD [Plastoroseomonas arctica]